MDIRALDKHPHSPKLELSTFVLLPDGHMSAAVTQLHGHGDTRCQGASFKKGFSSVFFSLVLFSLFLGSVYNF